MHHVFSVRKASPGIIEPMTGIIASDTSKANMDGVWAAMRAADQVAREEYAEHPGLLVVLHAENGLSAYTNFFIEKLEEKKVNGILTFGGLSGTDHRNTSHFGIAIRALERPIPLIVAKPPSQYRTVFGNIHQSWLKDAPLREAQGLLGVLALHDDNVSLTYPNPNTNTEPTT